jgi:DNA-directed RNA polymerase subunit RPC12/RpoP
MTIKILERGVDPKEIPMRFLCRNCGTKIECLKADMKTEPAYDMREVSYDYVPCPVCNTRITENNKCWL